FLLDDLSRWYVRLVRDRTWEERDAPTKRAAYRTLYDALMTGARLLAPFAPHLAEAIYQDLGGPHPTVHMEAWPKPSRVLTNDRLEARMRILRAATEAGSRARQNAGMSLRWPVARVVVTGGPEVGDAVKALKGCFLSQSNAKVVELAGPSWKELCYEVVPKPAAIGPVFKKEAGLVIAALKAADARGLKAALEKGPTELPGEGRSFTVTPEMVEFRATLPAHTASAEFAGGAVYVDTESSPELEAEGWTREVVRRIQEMRKEMGLGVLEEIVVEFAASDRLHVMVEARADGVRQTVRAKDVRFAAAPMGEHVKDWDLGDGESVKIGVRRA
ncbi:MAG: class I tRNA ligase family protein, partial [Methanobacteriota archaeon]